MAAPYDWLFETAAGCFVRKLIGFFGPVLAALAVLWMIQQTETRLAPVVTEWRLESIQRQDDSYVVSGIFRKTRACELVATSIMAVPKNPILPRTLIYQINPTEIRGGNVPVGLSTWGPWTVPIPAEFVRLRDHIDHLEIVGHHRCHALWNQETVYGQVPLERLP